MAKYYAEVTRSDTSEAINIGRVANAGKMVMFRKMQANGNAVVSLFDSYGDFTFVWNVKAKVWEFFDEAGILVGRMVAKRDEAAEYLAKVRQYREQKAAREAYEGAK